MSDVIISGTGLFTPPNSISNEELVEAFNTYVERFNAANAEAIARGEIEALQPSSSEFIVKASGIKSRYVMEKENILDPDVMAPRWPDRPNEEISVLAEIAVAAARQAMQQANKEPQDIDAVLVAASNMQRPYPAMAVEVQNALGIGGFGFDMNVACSSATFAIQTASDMVRSGNARAVLITNPEICSGHLNFRDRDSHFIFGDVATAVIVENKRFHKGGEAWDVIGTRLATQFSNNIRNNFGFLNRTSPETAADFDKLFVQEGRKVFRDVVPWVSELILNHLAEHGLKPEAMRRLWLHQANINMNELIARRVLGRDPLPAEAPVILDEYANTSSAGTIICFHKYRQDLEPGHMGLICSFGAGYSAGNVIVRRVS